MDSPNSAVVRADFETGKHLTKEVHSEKCKLKIHSEWESHNDQNWALAKRKLQPKDIGTSLPPAHRKPKAGISHPKSSAQNSDAVVHDDADLICVVGHNLATQAFLVTSTYCDEIKS